jgi:hypothetical protein
VKKKRRTKEQVLEEQRSIMSDVSSAIHYIKFQTVQEIQDFANFYRTASGKDPLTVAQVKKGIQLFIEEGMIRKRKEKYAYVNYR